MVPAPLLPTQALLQQFERPVAAEDERSAVGGVREAAEVREGFDVGPLHFAIRYEHGSMLVDPPPFIRLPNAPAWFHGMSNIDGALVPVFDLANLIGVEHRPGAKQMLLVLGHGEEQAGVVIDGIPRRLRLAVSHRLEEFAPASHLAGCVAAVYREDGIDWMDLRHNALLERFVELLAH
jgi:chemotaxis signal transduction protein